MTRGRSLDPWKLLAAFEAHRVSYVLVGDLAAVIHGSGDHANDVEIVPSMKPDNLARLDSALRDITGHPSHAGVAELPAGESATVASDAGRIAITPEPTGTRGYDDLRRAASREPIGSGVRPNVASLGDLIRIADAALDPQMHAHADRLRRVAELGLELGIEL